jgi:hypothetical protein
MQELVLHVGMVYNGYVSTMTWDKDKPTAHLLFALPDEAMAAAVTMQMVSRTCAYKLHFALPLQVYPEGDSLCPILLLRIGISSRRCDIMHTDDCTGRLVRCLSHCRASHRLPLSSPLCTSHTSVHTYLFIVVHISISIHRRFCGRYRYPSIPCVD